MTWKGASPDMLSRHRLVTTLRTYTNSLFGDLIDNVEFSYTQYIKLLNSKFISVFSMT